MGAFEFITDISNALSPSHWGEKAAESKIPETSRPLVEAYVMAKNYYDGDTLSECFTKEALGEDCDLNAPRAVQEQATNLLGRAVDNTVTAGGAGMFLGPTTVTSFFGAAFETAQNHKDTIELLAKNGVPGFAYEEYNFGGNYVKIWVDGTDAAMGEGEEASTYNNYSNLGGDTHPPQGIATKTAELISKAVGDAQDHISQNGHAGYQGLLDDLSYKTLSQYYVADMGEKQVEEAQRNAEIRNPNPLMQTLYSP